MTQQMIFEKVREAFVEALGVDDDEVQPESKIFDDLGAESLDLLEIVYLLEHEFDIKIPRREQGQPRSSRLRGGRRADNTRP